MAKIKQLTVLDLYVALGREVKNGNGSKKLIAADDNEGNGYHGVYYSISPMDPRCMDLVGDSQEMDPNNLMIIG